MELVLTVFYHYGLYFLLGYYSKINYLCACLPTIIIQTFREVATPKVYRLLVDRKPIRLTSMINLHFQLLDSQTFPPRTSSINHKEKHPLNCLFPRRAVKRNRFAKLSVIPSLTRKLTTSKTLTNCGIFGFLFETSEEQSTISKVNPPGFYRGQQGIRSYERREFYSGATRGLLFLSISIYIISNFF